MAKISARGDAERARWERDTNVIVLTERGRLLQKRRGIDATFTLLRFGRGEGFQFAPANLRRSTLNRQALAQRLKAEGFRLLSGRED